VKIVWVMVVLWNVREWRVSEELLIFFLKQILFFKKVDNGIIVIQFLKK